MSNVKILLDLQSCQSGSRLGGIGRYSLELAKAIVRRGDEHDIWVLLNSGLSDAINDVRWEFANLLPPEKLLSFECPRRVAEASAGPTSAKLAEIVREDFLSALKPDIVHVSSLFEGLHEDVVTSVGHVYPGDRTLVTLYDLIPLVRKEQYLADGQARRHYMRKIESLRRAGVLLSISEFSRKEAIDVLGLCEENVVNISSAADARFRPRDIAPEVLMALRSKYRFSRKFLMYTGSFDQRKNHHNLVEAYAKVPKPIRRGYQLLIVGNGWPDVYASIARFGASVGLEEDEVVFAGHVDDQDLLSLYNSCELFVFPSLAEGFGLPVLEAMSCGAPAIGSNCTSIPEVIGWKDALFNPHDPSDIAACITRALTQRDFAAALRDNGLTQARRFSWDRSASLAIQAFQAQADKTADRRLLFGGGGKAPAGNGVGGDSLAGLGEVLSASAELASLPELAVLEAAQCIAANRHQARFLEALHSGEQSTTRIGWITTWSTRCGIAAYSGLFVGSLPAPVTVLAANSEWINSRDQPNVIRCWDAGPNDSLEELFSQVVTLGLEAVVVQFNFGFFNLRALAGLLRRLDAIRVRSFLVFHSTVAPSAETSLSLILNELSLCQALFVHTQHDVGRLADLGLRRNVSLLPQGVIDSAKMPEDRAQFLSSAFVIATYGFALPHKGAKQLVQAFAKLSSVSEVPLHLLLVTAQYPADISAATIAAVKAEIRRQGVGEKVTLISEFLTDEQSLAYLRQADLIVYAYQETGESSSAAVRMGLAAGRPVAVTPLNIFSDVADATFVLPGADPNSLESGIRSIVDRIRGGAAEVDHIRRAARRWVEAHRWSSVGRHFFMAITRPVLPPVEYAIDPVYLLSANSSPLTYKNDFEGLKTLVGIVENGEIRSTGAAGPLVYGPWIGVAPGDYRVRLFGKTDCLDAGDATLEVVKSTGTDCIVALPLASGPRSGMIAEAAFRIETHGVRDLEVRVMVREGIHLAVSEVQLSAA